MVRESVAMNLDVTYPGLLEPGQKFEGLAMNGIDPVVVYLRDRAVPHGDAHVILSQLFPHVSLGVLENACLAVNQRVVEADEPLWLDDGGRPLAGSWFRRLEAGLPPRDSLDL